jgi:chromosomal replication initiation ATPase DnaA
VDKEMSKKHEQRYYNTQMDCIWEAVSRVCNVPSDVIVSPRRFDEWKMARFYFFYFARMQTNVTWKQMGLYAGGRDHTSAMHGYREICNYLDVDKTVKKRIEEIAQVLEGRIHQGEEAFGREKNLQNGFL